MKVAFVFPGQGSQSIGMGQALAEAFTSARETFEEVDDAIKQNLFRQMVEGPEDLLTLTENTQPALMSVSMAIIKVLEVEGKIDLSQKVSFVAGHSLGEYSALTSAKSLKLGDTARLLKIRGQAMQDAVPVGEGAMAALLGVNLDGAQKLADAAAEDKVCSPANDNSNDQVVISGSTSAIKRAIDLAPDFGVKRAMFLQVSAPFHCSLMAPAAKTIKETLKCLNVSKPSVPLIANVTAEPVQEPSKICKLLVEQTTGLVRWRETVLKMKSKGIDTIVEIGAGKVLSGLTRRIAPEISAISVSDPTGVDTLLNSM
ncbi:MAG: ACP S-malonyltransferase [Pseudomonadota bacterium]|nr:ACP S-malonyltransferase [Pseudomonadota bacterium]